MQNLYYENYPRQSLNYNRKVSNGMKKDSLGVAKKKMRTQRVSKVKIYAALIVWASVLLGALSINKPNFLEPVYLNRLNNSNLEFKAETVYAPTLNYANNLNFLNTNILANVPDKGKGKLLPITSTGELTALKNSILPILDNYKNLHAGIFIYDYHTGKTVDINKDEIFPAASIIKIPVLLDFFNRNKDLEKEGFDPISLDKKLTFTEAHRTEGSGNLQFKSANVDYSIDYLAKIMIRKSDNSATNMLIEEVGGINQLNAAIRHWGFSKTQVTSWLPDLKGTNTTTPYDIATMLYNIDNQKFLPIQSAANIKEYMSHVENRTLIKSQLPENAILMHKTGDIGKMLGDAGVIYSPSGKKYIMVIMVKRPHNDYGARDLIQKVSKTVYNSLG